MVAYLPSLLGFPSRALLFLTHSPLCAQFHLWGEAALQKPPRGVNLASGECIALFTRREMPAGAARPRIAACT